MEIQKAKKHKQKPLIPIEEIRAHGKSDPVLTIVNTLTHR